MLCRFWARRPEVPTADLAGHGVGVLVVGGPGAASARESCCLWIPARAYLFGGFSTSMFRVVKLIVGRVRLMRDMRGLHTKLPSLMLITGVASMDLVSVLWQVGWTISFMVTSLLSWVTYIPAQYFHNEFIPYHTPRYPIYPTIYSSPSTRVGAY